MALRKAVFSHNSFYSVPDDTTGMNTNIKLLLFRATGSQQRDSNLGRRYINLEFHCAYHTLLLHKLADIPGITRVFIYPSLLSDKRTYTHSYISYVYT
jgi:hypothetical protein